LGALPVVGVASAAAAAGGGAAAPAQSGPSGADVTLAVRLSDLAQATLVQQRLKDGSLTPPPTEAHLRLAAALLDGARRLHPDEPRYLRLLADALVRTRDDAAALEVVTAYRRLPAGADD